MFTYGKMVVDRIVAVLYAFQVRCHGVVSVCELLFLLSEDVVFIAYFVIVIILPPRLIRVRLV